LNNTTGDEKMWEKKLSKIAHNKKTTGGVRFIQAKEQSEDMWAAIEMLLDIIYPDNWSGCFGTYTTKRAV